MSFVFMRSFCCAVSVFVCLSVSVCAQQATPVEAIKLKEGFQVELLYSVPKAEQGSWVAMTQDDQGRLIVSDQYGSLYRVTPPALGGAAGETKVEKIPVEFGSCQGLLYAFGALYGVVNADTAQGRGLYRVKDTNGDDQFDAVELQQLREQVQTLTQERDRYRNQLSGAIEHSNAAAGRQQVLEALQEWLRPVLELVAEHPEDASPLAVAVLGYLPGIASRLIEE
jgi:hypothetical protein